MKTNMLAGAIYPHPPIIIGEIGRGEEVKAEKTIEGVKRLSKEISRLYPQTIIVVSPHGTAFRDAISILGEEKLYGNFSEFGHEELDYEYENDLELVEEIVTLSERENISLVKIDSNRAKDYKVCKELDHGSLVPLYFLSKELRYFNLVSITYGFLEGEELYKFGQVLKEAVNNLNRKTVVIASGDLSHRLSEEGHYPYSKFGKVFDEKVLDIVQREKLEEFVSFDKKISEPAGECGLRCFQILAGALKDMEVKSEIFSYEGPFGVGYLSSLLRVNYKDEMITLARQSLEYFVKNRSLFKKPENLSVDLIGSRGACFVTLKKHGKLRGCIGTISPVRESIADEIIENAVSAGIYDPRFLEVSEDELEDITYSVDLLFPPEQVEDISQLDPKNYGVIVSSGDKRGLLLPNLEGVESVKRQLEIALMKAGIEQGENYSIERFRVTRHE